MLPDALSSVADDADDATLLTRNRRITTLKTEIIAGLTLFSNMVYIIAVTPQVLHLVGRYQVFFATIVSSIIGLLIMGFKGNLPYGISVGMGLNTYFAHVISSVELDLTVAFTCVFIAGIIFIILILSNFNHFILEHYPQSLKHSMTAGKLIF